MSTREKALARMRNNPRDWRIDDLKAVADRFGIEKLENRDAFTSVVHGLGASVPLFV